MDRLLLTQSFRLSLRHPLQSQHSLPQLRRPLRVVVIHRHLIIVFLKNATFERPFHSIPYTTVSDSTNGDSLVARGGVNNGKRNARQRHRSPTPDSHRAARNRSASPAAQSHPPRRRRPSPTHVNDISNSAAATGAFVSWLQAAELVSACPLPRLPTCDWWPCIMYCCNQSRLKINCSATLLPLVTLANANMNSAIAHATMMSLVCVPLCKLSVALLDYNV